MFLLRLGHRHQLVAELGRSAFGRMQCPLLILTFVVFSAGIHVLLAVTQHGIDESRQLVRRGGDGLGRTHLRFLPAQEGAQGLSERCSPWAARRNAAAARLALGLVFELMTRPPVTRLSGLSPSQDASLALGHFVMSVPISLITFRAVKPSTPSILVRSPPVIRYRWVLMSKRGALP